MTVNGTKAMVMVTVKGQSKEEECGNEAPESGWPRHVLDTYFRSSSL